MATDRANTNASNYILGLGMIMLVVLIAHHPQAHGTSQVQRIGSILQQSNADRIVHGTVMGVMVGLGLAMGRFSAALGISGKPVMAAALSYLLGLGAGIAAMTFDGFVIPSIAQTCADLAQPCLASIEPILRLSSKAVQAFTTVSLLFTAAAVMLWSIALIGRGGRLRLAGLIGILSAAAQALLTVVFIDGLKPTTLLAVLAAQIVWYVTATLAMRSLAENPVGAGLSAT